MIGGGGGCRTRFVHRFRKIKENATSRTFPHHSPPVWAHGPAEIQGTVEKKSKHLIGPLSKKEVVQYHYVVKEKRGSGKKAKWVTITNTTELTDFYCRDSEGIVPVEFD
ncbi:MAG: hypothetical protein Ct9H300mP7_3670 [Verrucomicrobiota bacterium]|nr:MAG: hypothetical protein Ct9H300mP7_3670 [Verrucomicrobiota bacterium]